MPSQSNPEISVIVPVHNGGLQLGKCLDALLESETPAFEVMVVDDGSTDGSATAARARGLEVLRLGSRSGPAAARNHGALYARGSILLFVDADVVVRKDTLSRTAALFRARPEVAAVFGSYDDAPPEMNFVSQYKNLQHHFIHQQSSSKAETFWAGCGAVRREAFHDVGGFKAEKYVRPSVEDIELGYRLRRKGYVIALDRDNQVKHLKRWTFASLLRTDILNRAVPWSQLILEDSGMINDLSLRAVDRFSAALTAMAVVLLALCWFFPILLPAVLATSVAFFLLNYRFFNFLRLRRGLWFAGRAIGMLAFYYFYSGTVFILCYGVFVLRKVMARLGAAAATSRQISDA